MLDPANIHTWCIASSSSVVETIGYNIVGFCYATEDEFQQWFWQEVIIIWTELITPFQLGSISTVGYSTQPRHQSMCTVGCLGTVH